MPDLWMDVDTAVIAPVNILPLLDDTDFKTIETAVVYNSAGLVVTWNFVTAAGVVSGTAITPTTAGVYDWSEPIADKGMYAIEIPASGGASANNNATGFGWITGVATGILPWRGPTIGFRRAALNDLLVDGSTASTNLEDFFDGTGYAGGTAKLQVDAVAVSGDTAAADNAELFFDGTGYAAANSTIGTVTTLTNANPTAASVADAVWDEASTGHVDAGKAGEQLWTDLDAVLVDTAVIGAAGAGLTAVPWNAAWDAEVESEVDDAIGGGTGTALTAIPWNAAWDAEVESEANDALVVHRLDEILNADSDIDGLAPPTVGSVVHEMLSKTAGSFTFDQTTDSLEAVRDKETDIETDTQDIQTRLPAALVTGRMDSDAQVVSDKTGYSIASGGIGSGAHAAAELNAIADGVLDRNMTTGTDSGSTTVRTSRQSLRLLRNKASIAAGTLTVTKEDDSTASWTAAVTTTAGNPISSIDPAGP